jgi:putative ABC transport system substrate-binding protein
MIDRRLTFLVILALLAAFLAAEAQPPKKVRIGYLSSNPPSDTKDAFDAFRTKLGALGYLEGQNLLIESRYAESNQERLPQLAAELVVGLVATLARPGGNVTGVTLNNPELSASA